MAMFFFGCIGQPGHAIHTPGGLTVPNIGVMTPAHLEHEQFYPPSRSPARDQDERYMTLSDVRPTGANHERYAVLGMWDRSVDRRMNSKAAFVVEVNEQDDFPIWGAMLFDCEVLFPALTKRIAAFQFAAIDPTFRVV